MPHVSKSQLESLMSCPRLYWYERFEGVSGKSSLGAILGGTYHSVWEQFFRKKLSHGKTLDVEWATDTFSDEYDTRVREGLESESLEFESGDDQKQKDVGIGVVQAYHPYAVAIDPLHVEKQYELSIPGHDWTLYGYIDLIYKSYLVDEGGKPILFEDGENEGQQKWVAVVVDHKTTGSSPYDESKPGRYEDWLSVNRFSHEAIGYALAYRVLFGQTEDRFEYHYAIKTKTPRVVVSKIKIDDAQIRWYLDLAVEQIEVIKRGFFPRNTTSWKHTPRFCPAWNQCHGIIESGEQGAGQLRIV